MKQQVRDKYIPLVAIASPVLCFILQKIPKPGSEVINSATNC